ncbi:MAG: hypothetical protein K2K38_04920 [Clostridia bacterium]|nr:hypothetical protein [Clostridia bacterium]
MINYNKNDLINECLTTYYKTFEKTLDTCDYVPEKFNMKILKYIFKCMRGQFKKIDKEDRQFQRKVAKIAKGDLRKQKKEAKKKKKQGITEESTPSPA